jgi:hypothetical protein
VASVRRLLLEPDNSCIRAPGVLQAGRGLRSPAPPQPPPALPAASVTRAAGVAGGLLPLGRMHTACPSIADDNNITAVCQARAIGGVWGRVCWWPCADLLLL